MRVLKYEKRLLRFIYLLCLLLFVNIGLLEKPFDKFAIVMALVLCLLIGFSHFIIRRFYPDGDKFILIFASILAVISIATLYRIEKLEALKQLVWVGLGITCYILTVVIIPNLRTFFKFKKTYMIITLILMPLALIFGTTIGGAKNWIVVGPIMLQPSEFGKIALVLYLGSSLATYKNRKNFAKDFKQLIAPAMVTMFSLGCMVLQADLGSALIFFGISVTMLYVATSKKKYIVTSLGLATFGAITAYGMFSHVKRRVMIWKDPWAYANDESYQLVQGLYGITSGRLFGSGIGQGYPEYIPVNTTDFIYAVICEEFGMIFAVGIMVIYFLLFYRGIRAAFISTNKYSQLVAVGFSTMIACQTLVIIGGIFTIIPLTGITLPIISYGGSSILTIFFALGILQKISEEG